MEEWKEIKGYEGLYLISNKGNVYSIRSKRNLKIHMNWAGYCRVGLNKNNKQVKYSVHRLVASAFIPNPLNKEQVNHIDENKANNKVENLEWVTNLENHNCGTVNERISKSLTNNSKKSKRVGAFNDKGVLILEFPSIYEAERNTGINNCSIRDCIHHRKGVKRAGGYIWRLL